MCLHISFFSLLLPSDEIEFRAKKVLVRSLSLSLLTTTGWGEGGGYYINTSFMLTDCKKIKNK